ncbi:MFS transporter [Novosphingobium terrae]|uniref:MFS transporter n=1 Tax=Novosphingobium terrae TaxID=2726189 RepID=UPI00197D8F6E|nr:MFS transporter [Novosphingobium terrae]
MPVSDQALRQRPTRARLAVLALVTAATVLNYLDRSVMSVAAKPMSGELHLSPAMLGIIFSAFSWTYAAAQIPGGLLLDRLGTRITYACSLTLWSAFTLLHGFAGSIGTLIGLRFGLGLAEAPCYPCNSRILASWFPQGERARATGVYSIGQYFGLAFLSPLLFWIVGNWGWRSLFLLVGGIGIAFGLAWYGVYRDPLNSTRVNQAELAHIAAGGGLNAKPAPPFSWGRMLRLLGKRQILGASLGQFCSNSALVFLITWFPTYLSTERHLDFIKSGFYVALPYVAASAGVLSGGLVSDWLVRRTGSASIGRKGPVVAGLLLISTILSLGFIRDNNVLIAVMSVAAFGQGICNLGWTLISDVAPEGEIGLTSGLFNLCTNIAGIVTPMVIGFVVQASGSFHGALAYIGTVALLGVASYLFIIGDVHRLPAEG